MEPAKTPSKAKAIVSRVAGIVTIPLLAVIAVLIFLWVLLPFCPRLFQEKLLTECYLEAVPLPR